MKRLCPDCDSPVATKAQWNNNHNDGNGCECDECCAICWGVCSVGVPERIERLRARVAVLEAALRKLRDAHANDVNLEQWEEDMIDAALKDPGTP